MIRLRLKHQLLPLLKPFRELAHELPAVGAALLAQVIGLSGAVAQLRSSSVRACVVVTLERANGLVNADSSMLGNRSDLSDPFALLSFGNQAFKSSTIDNSLDPEWGEVRGHTCEVKAAPDPHIRYIRYIRYIRRPDASLRLTG